jgi:hypothetical protein
MELIITSKDYKKSRNSKKLVVTAKNLTVLNYIVSVFTYKSSAIKIVVVKVVAICKRPNIINRP